MAVTGAENRPPLTLEEIASAAAAVAMERDVASMAARLLSLVHAWAAPTATFCIERDAKAESGWRVLLEFASGGVPPGLERYVSKLVEDSSPAALARPMLVKPTEDLSGVKVRDTWVIPWSRAGASGFLLLRGISKPYPPNLGDAVTLAAQCIWPLVHAPNAEATAGAEHLRRLEDAAREALHLAERLRAETREAQEKPPSAPGGVTGGREPAEEEAQRQVTTLLKKTSALEKGLASAQADRDRAEAEAADLRDQLEEIERQIQSEKTRERKDESRALEDSHRMAKALEDALARRQVELDEAHRGQVALEEKTDAIEKARGFLDAEVGRVRSELEEALRQIAAFQENVETLENAHASGEAEREQLKVERNQLWQTIESLQRQVESDKKSFEVHIASTEDARRALDQSAKDAASSRAGAEAERDEALAALEAAAEGVKLSKERERILAERWEKSVASFRAAVEALKRTPFVPPTLRVSLGAVEGFLERGETTADQHPPSKGIQVLLLDREAHTVEGLATELEKAGIDVLVAHYPEEVGFFLKTPDARRLNAVICDVMAFRSDQDLVEILRSWRQDSADLASYLSFKADNPLESEKAQRVPAVLAAGYLPRPLQRDAVIDALTGAGRKTSSRPAESPPSDRAGARKGTQP